MDRLEAVDERWVFRAAAALWLLLHGSYLLWPYIERLLNASSSLRVSGFA
ncbi:MAG: hypothetical protein ACE148_16240 [Vicinamibacterales bacterium]